MAEREPLVRALALDAADLIKYDLTGRAGFDVWWGGIDPDVQDEIEQAWVAIIADTFKEPVDD